MIIMKEEENIKSDIINVTKQCFVFTDGLKEYA